MKPAMLGKVGGVIEAPTAHCTLKGLFPGMKPAVCRQGRALGESLTADGAAKGPFARMHSQMLLQIRSAPELLGTREAQEGLGVKG